MCGSSPAECLNCTRSACIYETQRKPGRKPAPKKRGVKSTDKWPYIKHYRDTHPEKVRVWKQNFNRTHPNYEAEYRAANREKRAAYNRQYRQTHKPQDRTEANKRAYQVDPQKQRDRNRAIWKRNQQDLAGQGALIRRSRLNNGFTQAELAEQLHMSRGAISVWETDRAPANWEKLSTVFPEYEGFTFEGANANGS